MAKVVYVVGDDVSTDVIYPGRFMATVLPTETPQLAFADDTEFNGRLKAGQVPPGSVMVAESHSMNLPESSRGASWEESWTTAGVPSSTTCCLPLSWTTCTRSALTSCFLADWTSTDFGLPGDADLTALAGYDTYDAAVLEFDFIPTAPHDHLSSGPN